MEGIRIIALPAATMVSSGTHDLDAFDQWWSALDKEREDKFFPRDFLGYDPEANRMVWYYALPAGVTDTGGYETVPFPGGLYAVAISKDQDDADGQRVYKAIQDWVAETGCFDIDERPGRYTLSHVVTPDAAYIAMGYRQLDIFVPIKVK